MPPEPETSFELRLRETLVSLCVDKDAIETLTIDALIDWSFVNPDGSPRDVWRSIVQEANRQEKTKNLIEAALARYKNNKDLAALLLENTPSKEKRPVAPGKLIKPWVLIDRKRQFEDVESTISGNQDRPVVVIWLGDEGSRVDLFHDRVNYSEYRMSGRVVKDIYFSPCLDLHDLNKGLMRSCENILQGKVADDSPIDVKSLLSGQDFRNQLVVIRVDLSWNSSQTPQQIREILSWRDSLGSVSSDRRLIVAVSVEVRQPTGLLSRFFSKSLEEQILDAERSLAEAVAGRAKLLPVLPSIRFDDLLEWSNRLETLLGPRNDDLLGYDSLKSIVPPSPPERSRPMGEVVKEVMARIPFSNTHVQRV